MKIGIAGPVATEDIIDLLNPEERPALSGYAGAPFLSTLIREYLARGHSVSVYTTDVSLHPRCTVPVVAHGDHLTVYYLPYRSTTLRPRNGHLGRSLDFFRVERMRIRDAILTDSPDVVHAHWSYEFALAAIASGRPHLITCHDSPRRILKFARNYYWLGRYLMARTALRKAALLTTVSPYMKNELSELSGRSFEIIPNPIDPYILEAGQQRLQAQGNEPGNLRLSMVINGFSQWKNSQAGLLAFAEIRKKHPTARLICFGSDHGPGEAAATWAIANEIAEGVDFLGRHPRSDVLTSIATTSLLLHPSLEESFGMTVAEAMALGIPVIAGNESGAVPWLLGNDENLLVDVSNPFDIAAAALQLLDSPFLMEQCRKRVHTLAKTRLSVEVVADCYENLYGRATRDTYRNRDREPFLGLSL